MSQAKRSLEAQENKRRVAAEIAISAGVINRCEMHKDCLFAADADKAGAYKLGNHKFDNNELEGVFETRLEMTAAIKAAIEDNSGQEECPRCNRD
jgi:hypothetical protein